MYATDPVYTGVPARGLAATARALSAPLGSVAAIGAGCAVIYFGNPMTPGGPLPVCPLKALLGIDCPGCGGMRMVDCVLHGDLSGALHYNALAFVVCALSVWSLAAWTLGRLRGRHMRSWIHSRWTQRLMPVALVVWFVVRLLPFAPFNALYV